MKRILVTGATGFVGNYVVAELVRLGYFVIASSINIEKAKSAKWTNTVTYIRFDLSDFDANENYYEFFGRPDLVIHLSWEGLPNYKSLFHFEVNLPRHYAFLKNLITNGCKDLSVAGTCLEYGMKEGALSEDLPSEPANAYALAKDSLNKFLAEFQKTHPFSFKWIRLFYMYGKGQNPNSIFSQLEQALISHQVSFNMSGGEQVRDYLPVEMASSYIVKIALQDKVSGIINCCSGIPVKLKHLVENFLEGRRESIHLNFGYYPYADYEPMAFWGENKKLKMIINE